MKLSGEDAEQQALFQYASYKSGNDPRWALLFSIPNGGKRWISTALKMKATGLKPGVPDIFFPYGAYPVHGLFIEMKYGKGRVSPVQSIWHRNLRSQGYCVEVCYGADDAIDVITRYMDGRFDISQPDVVSVTRTGTAANTPQYRSPPK